MNKNIDDLVSKKKILLSDDFEDGEISSEWHTMRMEFIEQEGRLNVVSKSKQGFNYGHWGNGRSAAVFTHIGDSKWTDYRIELDVFGGGPGEFNPHEIDNCMRGGFSIFFRTVNYPENWNERAQISYAFGLSHIPDYCEGKPFPEWDLSRIDGWYASKDIGYCGSITKNYFIPKNGLSPAVTSDVDALWTHLVLLGYLSENGVILEKIASFENPSEMQIDAKYINDRDIIFFIRLNRSS